MKHKLQNLLKHNWRTLLLLFTLITTSQGVMATDYWIRGSMNSWGSTKMPGGVLKLNLTSGTNYEFKITSADNTWDNDKTYGKNNSNPTCGNSVELTKPGDNLSFTPNITGDHTFTFNGTSLTITCPTPTYYVAGNGSGHSDGWCDNKDWDAAGSQMSGSTASIKFSNIAISSDLQFKVTIGSWSTSYGWDKYSSSKSTLSSHTTVSESDGNIKIQITTNPHDITIYYDGSNVYIETEEISSCTPPTVTSTGNSRCGTGKVTLNASTTAGTISWWAASSGGSALGTGTSYTTPSISSTTTYYVSATDGGCTSDRVAVTATVKTIPTISSTTPGSNCGPGKVTLGATASAGSVNWYSTSTGGSKISTGTSYTTGSLSTTTTYYVDATSNSCTTASRTAVTATIKTIPSISGTTPGSRCGAGAVTLGATASAGSVNWYSTSTGGSSLKTGTSYITPSISSTKTYYVDATNNGCTTASRTAVTATVNANPSAPVISSYDESVCSGSAPKFTFSSTSGLTYQMYVGSSTSGSSVAGDGSSKTLTAGAITSATTFKLRATNANGCYASSSNAAVSITPNMALTSITLSPSTICTDGESTVTANELVLGGGSVAYTSSARATATVAKVSDSEATVSGVAVGSSTITATLSGGCGSNVFQTATITVSAGPAKYILSAAGGTTICSAGGKLRLSGSESSCSYQLYKNGSAYGSPVEGTGSAIEFDVFESGDYVCRAYLTSSPSCYTVMTGEVTLHISLTPTLIPATPTVTSYTPVTITSINTDILTWEISGEGNTAYLYDKTSNTVKVKASAAGSPYTITATTSGGCSQTATLTVNADVEKCN